MERGARARSLAQARTETYVIRPVGDAASIRQRLLMQRGYAAYALGQLSPHLFPLVTCWEARGPAGHALALFSRGGLGDALFLNGNTAPLEALLSVHQGPRSNFATFLPEHLEAVRTVFDVASPREMIRMTVERRTFRAVHLESPQRVAVRRLTAQDTRGVNRLYNTEGQPTYYSATHIDRGSYHGLFVDGKLMAVAGTHVIAPEEDVAVVGNVFTHPAQRGLGFGTIVTGTTTDALLRETRHVALTVDAENEPAIRAYRRLGYVEDCRIIESVITRRSHVGLRPFIAERLARWRGRATGTEIVHRRA